MCKVRFCSSFKHKLDSIDYVNDTHREELNSVQKFVKIKSWLLLTFSMCLHNQLKCNDKFYNLIKITGV